MDYFAIEFNKDLLELNCPFFTFTYLQYSKDSSWVMGRYQWKKKVGKIDGGY